jgi:multiple sugar transport system permease protein
VVTTLVAVAVVWRYLYHPRYGLLNHGLGLVGIPPIDWLGDPGWAMPRSSSSPSGRTSATTCDLRRRAPDDPRASLYEAAALDGAGRWQQFRAHHAAGLWRRPRSSWACHDDRLLPALRRAVRDDPAAARSTPHRDLVLLMYEEGFRWWNMGYAAAIAFVLFLIILAATGCEALRLRLREGGR